MSIIEEIYNEFLKKLENDSEISNEIYGNIRGLIESEKSFDEEELSKAIKLGIEEEYENKEN